MTEILVHAYTPLVFWTFLGLILVRFLPTSIPKILGRSLYWVGVPMEILALARRTNFSEGTALALLVTVAVLLSGLSLTWLSLQGLNRWFKSDSNWLQLQERSSQGSFVLSAMLGNTGFIGLAIAPLLISDQALSLVIFYSISQNLLGTYGSGVFLASYYGRQSTQSNHWWLQVRDVLSVPSLWAFTIGSLTRNLEFPSLLELGLKTSVWFVIPTAFLLMGIRLGQIKGWKSFQLALIPALLKVIVVPGLVGIATTIGGLSSASRLALVLMSGMPTAFASLILAEEYDLDRELFASSIIITSVLLLFMIPCWLILFGE
jgi:predicted permease